MSKLNLKLVRKSFVMTKFENSLPWTYLLNYFNGEVIFGMIYEKNFLEKKKEI